MSISDRRMATLGRKLKDLQEQVKPLEDEISDIKRQITDELERRGTKMILHDGVRITYRRNDYVNYDEAKLKRLLRRRPEVLKRVFSALDKNALGAEVQEGEIDPTLLDKATEITHSEPWPIVTFVK